jgi:uncharacterized membrane protein
MVFMGLAPSIERYGVFIRRWLGRWDGFLTEQVYSSRPMMEFLLMFMLVYAVLDAIIIVWFFVTPLAVQSDNRLVFGLGMMGYNVGYLVSNCHQMPQRSLMIGDFQIPFCSRDTAIYVGCLLAAVAPFYLRLPKFAKTIWFAGLLMAPMAVDGVSQTIFLMRESNNALRVATGLSFGFGMVYFLAAHLVERSRQQVDIRAESMKAVRIGVFVVAVLLASSYYFGGVYVTRPQAVKESGLNPSFVTYLSHRSLQTIPWDPYLPSYDDAVLRELDGYSSGGRGVWVIYDGPMLHEGKYVWFSGGGGTFKLIPDSQ